MNNNNFYMGEGFKGQWLKIIPRNIIEMWNKDSVTARLYITDVGYFPCAARHYRERTEGINENICIFCLEGKGTIELAGKKYLIDERDAFIIPGGKSHVYYADWERPWSILWMHYAGVEAADYITTGEKVTIENSEAVKEIVKEFTLLKDKVLGEDDGVNTSGRAISHIAALILDEISSAGVKHVKTTGRINSKTKKIIEWMKSELKHDIKLSEIAERFGTSETGLCTTFKRNTGKSPLDYFTSLRMQEAARLLLETDMLIYEVALELGYEDQYYFSRVFKKIIGESPRNYRKRGI